MKQLYHHYEEWEDYKMGLFSNPKKEIEEFLIRKAMDLLKDGKRLYQAMALVGLCWNKSAEVNLSNSSRNRQAWLGQASCCMVYGTPENLTKEAWHRLTTIEQDRANAIADQIISLWDNKQRREFKCQKENLVSMYIGQRLTGSNGHSTLLTEYI